METVNTSARLKALRSLMKSNNVDVYVVPSEDSHQSEYIAGCDARRGEWRGFFLFVVFGAFLGRGLGSGGKERGRRGFD